MFVKYFIFFYLTFSKIACNINYMRKKKFNKSEWYFGNKLFTVNNFEYDKSKFILSIGPDVYLFAKEICKYNLNQPKKLESFLRKCFRAYWEEQN